MEPSLTWGLRMAVATTVPVVWGIATGHLEMAEWIALTADSICWIALKGNFAQRLRILTAGALLTFLFTVVGSLTGQSIVLSIIFMMLVAFMAGLFKNLGERGSGLSLCLYVMFLLSNAYPVKGIALEERLFAVGIGGAWNAVLGMVSVFFIPVQQPYRRTIAIIWRATAKLMQTISKGWDGEGTRSTQREIYLSEQAVRDALDTSFVYYEKAMHQFKGKEEGSEYKLAQVRKAAALVATHIIAIAEELERVRLAEVDEDLRLRLSSLMRSIKMAAERMGMLSISRRTEDELLLRNALDVFSQKLSLLEDYQGARSLSLSRAIRRVIHLGERCHKLISRSEELFAGVGETSVFRSYSLIKTVYVLHPKHWLRSIRLLFSLDSHTTRYAIRTAIAAGLAIAIDKIFVPERGYWLPLTVIIILQPYFVATFRKAIDRLIGTIAGGIAGGIILLIPGEAHMKELMLFVSAVAMVHFFRTRYRVSSFFITLNLVLLFSVSQELKSSVIFLRAGLTLAGAVIAVLAGFLLLPAWDRKYLPRFVAQALERNWLYFKNTFSAPGPVGPWTRCKRQAEVSNSNAFDSFNRAMQEPGGLKRDHDNYYQLIAHNMRVTRELNNFHIEEEAKNDLIYRDTDEKTRGLIERCTAIFQESLHSIQEVSGKPLKQDLDLDIPAQLPEMNAAQRIYLERLSLELQGLKEDIQKIRTLP